MSTESFETATEDRLPPHSPEMERGVLGCILREPVESVIQCLEIGLSKESFYELRHQRLFEMSVAMHDRGEHIDVLTLFQKFSDKNELDGIGGIEYISQLENDIPSASNLGYYADVVKDKHTLRKIISAGTAIVQKAYDNSGSIDDVLTSFERDVLAVQSVKQPKTSLGGKSLVNLLGADLDRRMNLNGSLSGLDTGFYDLNRMTEGLQYGEHFVIGARPSLGKTAMGIAIFRHCVFNLKLPALFISLEMSSEAIMRRLCSAETGVSLNELKSGRISESDFPKITAFSSRCSRSPIHIVDGISGMTMREIAAVVRRMKLKHDLKLVVVDYMQKIRPDAKHEKRTYEVGDVSGKLKALAVENGVALITLAQLNRENEKQKGRLPRASDLADSGQIERDADLIGLLHKDDQGNRSMLIVKQRDGEVGSVDLAFLAKCVRFESVSRVQD